MTSIDINEASIPPLQGKRAVISGGTLGIGQATAQLLAQKGADVCILDINPPPPDGQLSTSLRYILCDVSDWTATKSAFADLGPVDMVFANAGMREHQAFLATDEHGDPTEPDHRILDLNLRGVINVLKLSWCMMKKQPSGGNIVLTSSNLAYAASPWQTLYSATKLALIGLVRSLRTIGPQDNITINAVAPSPTATSMLPETFVDRLTSAGIPVSLPRQVALALVYSASAVTDRQVEPYGKDSDDVQAQKVKWNGRVIFTLGDQYTEVEGPIADLKGSWLGIDNADLTRAQQVLIDRRTLVS